MTTKKPTFLEENLKRWPIYVVALSLLGTMLKYVISSQEAQMRTESKVDKICEILAVKESAAKDKFDDLKSEVQEDRKAVTEINKKVFVMWELYRKQIKKEED